MRRSVVLGGALLIGIMAGGTVLASPVAEAAQAVLPVFVTNTPAQPVPVREHALVATDKLISEGSFPNETQWGTSCRSTSVLASALILTAMNYPVEFRLGVSTDGCGPGASDMEEISLHVTVAANETMAVSLPERVMVNATRVRCGSPDGICGFWGFSLTAVGTPAP